MKVIIEAEGGVEQIHNKIIKLMHAGGGERRLSAGTGGMSSSLREDYEDTLRKQRELINALTDEIEQLKKPQGWQVPQRGDKVKLIKQPPHVYKLAAALQVTVGRIYEVRGCGIVNSMEYDSEAAKHDPEYAVKITRFGILIKDDTANTTVAVPLDCFEHYISHASRQQQIAKSFTKKVMIPSEITSG